MCGPDDTWESNSSLKRNFAQNPLIELLRNTTRRETIRESRRSYLLPLFLVPHASGRASTTCHADGDWGATPIVGESEDTAVPDRDHDQARCIGGGACLTRWRRGAGPTQRPPDGDLRSQLRRRRPGDSG
ncbi:hypothetical protein BRADI_1g29723v3 [Brachypodium distachyon]|uniref:Uncharacterized protein n=1 Tax=Brachypodium distachyon TaxID=15368 RepID=A0A0Q3H0W1_BRADI|nr:hypothetical protein BRADI_1g29723v3 [Brachypodium distachyon]